MRIIFVAYDGPNNNEGPMVNLRRLLPALKQAGHDPHALIIRWGDHSPASDFFLKHEIPCQTLSWPSSTEAQIHGLLKRVQEIQPDIFVANYSASAGFASRWIRASGIPTVTICRSDDDLHWNMAQQFVLGNDPWSVSGCVCVDDDLKQRIATAGPTQTELTVIPSGVPLPKKPGGTHSPFRLAYVGRLVEEQKRISQVIKSMCRALEQLPQATGIVIGDGPESNAMKDCVEARGLSDRLEFSGWVPHTQIAQRLTGVSATILLSDYEGTPGAIMDSMASGVVPICRDIRGGVRQLVRDQETGRLIDGSIESTVAAVVSLAHSPDQWNRLSRQARQHVSDQFSIERAVSKWETFCEQLLTTKQLTLPSLANHTQQANRPITIPKRLQLPPVRPALAAIDVRESFDWKQKAKSIERLFRGARKRLLG